MPKSTLSDTAHAVLNAAREHPERLAGPPARLPVAAQRTLVRSLLSTGLLEEVEANDGQPSWRQTDAGQALTLYLTDAGLLAIDLDAAAPGADMPGQIDAAESMDPQPSRRETVRRSAQAVTDAWDDDLVKTHPALASSVISLRNALTNQGSTPTVSGTPRQPRPDTKRALVLGLLRRPEGATVAQVAEATGWARHTVHGFFAGLKKAGTPVEVLERVRQVGPGKQGAAGSYTVYRAAEAG